MEEARPVKSKPAKRSFVGVKVLKKKPGKTSGGASLAKRTKTMAKADTVATSEKTKKQKDKMIVKATKSTRTGNEAEDTEPENSMDTTYTATTKEPKAAKKIQETKTVKKTKQNKENFDTTAGTSKMKVKKIKSKVVKNIQKNEVSDKKSKMIEEVFEAIKINGEPRKGATSQAIKKYIFSKRGVENEGATQKRLNNRINQVLRQAVENGDLEKPATAKGTEPMPSAIGRFKLVKKVTKSKVSKKPNAKEDGEDEDGESDEC